MPIPSQAEINAFVAEHGPYRLECVGLCFRDDFDGVKELPSDWDGVHEVQSLRDSLSTYDDKGDPPPGYSVLDWATHIGLCPWCKAEGRE